MFIPGIFPAFAGFYVPLGQVDHPVFGRIARNA
jgi:hypothetical protein